MSLNCLCLGPKRAGKTHLLKALQDPNSIDETTYSMPTMGTSIYTIKFPKNTSTDACKASTISSTTTDANAAGTSNENVPKKSRQKKALPSSIQVLEIGGSLAPLWRQYYDNVKKLIYVVDTSNLCQISAAGVLLYSLLVEPRLQRIKVLIVLAKMDYAYRQMRNEALLMLRMAKLQEEASQKITIVEASAVRKDGLDAIYHWLQHD